MASVFRCCPKLPGHLQRESHTRVRALDGGGDVTEHPPSQEVVCQQETKKKVDSLSPRTTGGPECHGHTRHAGSQQNRFLPRKASFIPN